MSSAGCRQAVRLHRGRMSSLLLCQGLVGEDGRHQVSDQGPPEAATHTSPYGGVAPFCVYDWIVKNIPVALRESRIRGCPDSRTITFGRTPGL